MYTERAVHLFPDYLLSLYLVNLCVFCRVPYGLLFTVLCHFFVCSVACLCGCFCTVAGRRGPGSEGRGIGPGGELKELKGELKEEEKEGAGGIKFVLLRGTEGRREGGAGGIKFVLLRGTEGRREGGAGWHKVCVVARGELKEKEKEGPEGIKFVLLPDDSG